MRTKFKIEYCGIYRRLPAVFFVAISVMTAFELAKTFLVRDIGLWKSHVITIVFSSLIAVLVSFCVLKRFQKNKERFQNLVESTSDWVWEVDEEGRYTYASPRIRDLLGYEPEEVLHKTPFDLMPHEEEERVREIFATVLARRAPLISIENINLHKDGHQVVLETSGIPFFDVAGEFCGYRGIDRDITERKRLEAEREKITADLAEAMSKVKTLSGFLPICSHCKKIRDDKGYWKQIEAYIRDHSEAEFSHGICPDCLRKFYPENYDKIIGQDGEK